MVKIILVQGFINQLYQKSFSELKLQSVIMMNPVFELRPVFNSAIGKVIFHSKRMIEGTYGKCRITDLKDLHIFQKIAHHNQKDKSA